MASLVGAGGRVLCEPNPVLQKRLRDYLCLNRLGQVEIISSDAADKEEMMEFYGPALNDRNSGNGHVIESHLGDTGTIRGAARRLDTTVAGARCER